MTELSDDEYPRIAVMIHYDYDGSKDARKVFGADPGDEFGILKEYHVRDLEEALNHVENLEARFPFDDTQFSLQIMCTPDMFTPLYHPRYRDEFGRDIEKMQKWIDREIANRDRVTGY